MDAQTIFFKKSQGIWEQLTNSIAYYLRNAHSAEADVMATFEVLDAQVGKYDDVPNEIAELSDFSSQNRFADRFE